MCNKCTWSWKNIVDGMNKTENIYLNEKIELLGKLTNNDTSKIVIISSASKDVSINFSEQCLNIITNNDSLNGIKGRTKIKNR